MILGLIIACEIGFWVAIVAGLSARYLARKPRLGAVLLAMAPVVDLILLIAVAIDLRAGASATFAHALAALYIGISIAYGHSMIRWADVRFAHRFSDGPAPTKRYGREYTAACWKDVVKTGLAGLIAGAILLGLIAWVGAPERTEALSGILPLLAVVLGIEILWAVSYTVWPKKAPARLAATN